MSLYALNRVYIHRFVGRQISKCEQCFTVFNNHDFVLMRAFVFRRDTVSAIRQCNSYCSSVSYVVCSTLCEHNVTDVFINIKKNFLNVLCLCQSRVAGGGIISLALRPSVRPSVRS